MSTRAYNRATTPDPEQRIEVRRERPGAGLPAYPGAKNRWVVLVNGTIVRIESEKHLAVAFAGPFAASRAVRADAWLYVYDADHDLSQGYPHLFPRQLLHESLVVISGDQQTAEEGSMLTLPIEVEARNAQGAPAGAGIGVSFAPQAGTLSGTDPATGANSRARTFWTLPPVPGTYQMQITTSGGAQVVVTATATEAASLGVITIEIVSGDMQTGEASAQLGEQAVVRVLEDGSPAPGRSVSWQGAQGLIPSNAEAITDVDGLARSDVILGSVVGDQELSVTSAGASTPATFSFTATAPAGQVTVSHPPPRFFTPTDGSDYTLPATIAPPANSTVVILASTWHGQAISPDGSVEGGGLTWLSKLVGIRNKQKLRVFYANVGPTPPAPFAPRFHWTGQVSSETAIDVFIAEGTNQSAPDPFRQVLMVAINNAAEPSLTLPYLPVEQNALIAGLWMFDVKHQTMEPPTGWTETADDRSGLGVYMGGAFKPTTGATEPQTFPFPLEYDHQSGGGLLCVLEMLRAGTVAPPPPVSWIFEYSNLNPLPTPGSQNDVTLTLRNGQGGPVQPGVKVALGTPTDSGSGGSGAFVGSDTTDAGGQVVIRRTYGSAEGPASLPISLPVIPFGPVNLTVFVSAAPAGSGVNLITDDRYARAVGELVEPASPRAAYITRHEDGYNSQEKNLYNVCMNSDPPPLNIYNQYGNRYRWQYARVHGLPLTVSSLPDPLADDAHVRRWWDMLQLNLNYWKPQHANPPHWNTNMRDRLLAALAEGDFESYMSIWACGIKAAFRNAYQRGAPIPNQGSEARQPWDAIEGALFCHVLGVPFTKNAHGIYPTHPITLSLNAQGVASWLDVCWEYLKPGGILLGEHPHPWGPSPWVQDARYVGDAIYDPGASKSEVEDGAIPLTWQPPLVGETPGFALKLVETSLEYAWHYDRARAWDHVKPLCLRIARHVLHDLWINRYNRALGLPWTTKNPPDTSKDLQSMYCKPLLMVAQVLDADGDPQGDADDFRACAVFHESTAQVSQLGGKQRTEEDSTGFASFEALYGDGTAESGVSWMAL